MKQIFESENIRFVAVSERLVQDYLIMVNDIEHVEKFIGGWHEPFTEEQEIRWVQKKLAEKVPVFSMLEKNAPCITAFGLKKSWCQAVTRNEIDQYSTKFDNAVNVIAPGGLIPITFAEWKLDTRLMNPPTKRGSPVTTRLNHFQGWHAEIPISYTEHVYSINEIITIINYAGFGIGIGSGRTSGYGRYHVVNVK